MTNLNPVVADVTARIIARSAEQRGAYLERMAAAAERGPARGRLACANLAHGFAASGTRDKRALRRMVKPNIAIVSSYNDMLSAHKPFESYPAQLKQAVLEAGGIAQFAGGVPAMCDGITQGRDGMQLSLFSRDVIAMATAIALSHDMFDGALLLGVCDKIVPGMLIGALGFGHLPAIFVPAGPMTSGLPNSEKSRIRQLYAEGKVDREALLDAEAASYHGSGTCTFYGTANSNQLLMEAMGLHLPGSSLVNPDTPLRDALTAEAGRRVTGSDRARRAVHAGRRGRRRTRRRQRMRRAAGHRRVDQPHHAPGRDRPCRGNHVVLERHRRPVGRRAAAGPRVPERPRRRQPLPRRGRHGVRHQLVARRRTDARRRAHGGRRRAAPLHHRTASWTARGCGGSTARGRAWTPRWCAAPTTRSRPTAA